MLCCISLEQGLQICGILISVVTCIYAILTFHKSGAILETVDTEKKYRWNKKELESLFSILSFNCITDFFRYPIIIRDALWRELRWVDLDSFQYVGKEKDDIVTFVKKIGDISLMGYKQTPSGHWKYSPLSDKDEGDYEKEQHKLNELDVKVNELRPLYNKIKGNLTKYHVDLRDMETKARRFYEKAIAEEQELLNEPQLSSERDVTKCEVTEVKKIYDGNYLFHFTNFESALKIIATHSLKFGDFNNMNDIAEVKRDLLGDISESMIEEEMRKYKSISMTLDTPERGFFINPLWGHYAQKGNGVCLMFDKDKLINQYQRQFGNDIEPRPINYLEDSHHLTVINGKTQSEVENDIMNKIDVLFFTKSSDWSYEQEFRFLLKDKDLNLNFCKDSLVAVILCLPKLKEYKETPEFMILKALLKDIPVLHYQTSLGNKELIDEDGNQCDIDKTKRELANNIIN